VTKLVALVLAAFGFVNLWIAVAADMGASLAVTLNGMRLALPRPRKE
jgi:Cd2+/Zn2+-exporting ATPase